MVNPPLNLGKKPAGNSYTKEVFRIIIIIFSAQTKSCLTTSREPLIPGCH